MLFTQNIDCLERAAGVPADRMIEAHGSFATQRCIECKREFPDDKMREHVFAGKVPHCANAACNGVVKPDIVFFGESLPPAFGQNSHKTSDADLVLIIGTSLTVYPFAGLPELVGEGKPRVLFNMERVGRVGGRPDDVVELGPCDDGIRDLADALGWRDELEQLWRDVVGDEEAERQLQSRDKKDLIVEDEMQKLAEGVEAALKLDEETQPVDGAKEHGDVGASRREAPAPSRPSSSKISDRPAVDERAAPELSPVKESEVCIDANTAEPSCAEQRSTAAGVEDTSRGKLESDGGGGQTPLR